MENQVNVIAVNCVETDSAGIVYRGGSRLLNAKGEIVAQCPDNEETVLIGELKQ